MKQIRWGLIGTGFAATQRATAIAHDPRARLVAIASREPSRAAEFCRTIAASQPKLADSPPVAVEQWRSLLELDLDVVAVCTIPRVHAEQTRAVLQSGKHAVVEYPLAFEPEVAHKLLAVARSRDRLLHVEHIELLGGLHRAAIANLPSIGTPYYARYITLLPKQPGSHRWSYNRADFGFPLVGALSRVMRLVDAFGAVAQVSASVRYWPKAGDRAGGQEHTPNDVNSLPSLPNTPNWQHHLHNDNYTSCLARGLLEFRSGVTAEVVYGKGDRVWMQQNQFDVLGEAGALTLGHDRGWLIQNDDRQELAIGARRGMFTRDTEMVTAALLDGAPLYVQPEHSIYALEVADALRQAAEQGQPIALRADI